MLTQDYAAYSAADHATWVILYQRQVKAVQQYAYAPFWDALRLLDFEGGFIPVFGNLNKRLARLTGWAIYPVAGLVDNAYFYDQMHSRRFSASTWLRHANSFYSQLRKDNYRTEPFVGGFMTLSNNPQGRQTPGIV